MLVLVLELSSELVLELEHVFLTKVVVYLEMYMSSNTVTRPFASLSRLDSVRRTPKLNLVKPGC